MKLSEVQIGKLVRTRIQGGKGYNIGYIKGLKIEDNKVLVVVALTTDIGSAEKPLPLDRIELVDNNNSDMYCNYWGVLEDNH